MQQQGKFLRQIPPSYQKDSALGCVWFGEHWTNVERSAGLLVEDGWRTAPTAIAIVRRETIGAQFNFISIAYLLLNNTNRTCFGSIVQSRLYNHHEVPILCACILAATSFRYATLMTLRPPCLKLRRKPPGFPKLDEQAYQCIPELSYFCRLYHAPVRQHPGDDVLFGRRVSLISLHC